MRGTCWIKRAVLGAGILIGLATAAPASAGPIVVRFEAVDLADVVPGEDLWQYQYVVSDYVFEVDQGFSIYFDPALYANLQDSLEVNADWDVIAVQPDPALPADGFFDALCPRPRPSAPGNWWCGSGASPSATALAAGGCSAGEEVTNGWDTGRAVCGRRSPGSARGLLAASGTGARDRRLSAHE